MAFRPFQRSIASYTEEPQNNYQLLRFVAAMMVIFGHSYAITKLPGRAGMDFIQRALHFTYSGGIGVDAFFVISGFLVTASYLNRRNWSEFMKARCLRIFPGLIVCVLAMVFLLGPVVTTLPALQYFTDSELYSFLFRNITLVSLHFTLPGVFETLPRAGAVNGSLWTLPAEFFLYILLSIFGAIGILFSRRWYGLFILLCCAVAIGLCLEVGFFAEKSRYLRLVILFAAGSVVRVYAAHIPLSTWIFAALSVVTATLVSSTCSRCGWCTPCSGPLTCRTCTSSTAPATTPTASISTPSPSSRPCASTSRPSSRWNCSSPPRS
jgi:peptidoglycan/LPS O-acetylase OafA/YrhL